MPHKFVGCPNYSDTWPKASNAWAKVKGFLYRMTKKTRHIAKKMHSHKSPPPDKPYSSSSSRHHRPSDILCCQASVGRFAAKLVLEDHVHASPRCLFLRPFMPSASGAARPWISSPNPISLFGSDILLFVVNHSVIRQSYSCRSGLWPLLLGDSPHHARDFC